MNPKKLLICFFCILACTANAQDTHTFSRPLTWIVPFTAGGATDVLAREIADKVSRQLGQQIVIENLGGAGGTIGATKAARTPAEGYVYLVGHLGYMGAAPSLYPKLAYDPIKDFDPVFRFPDTPMVLLVNAAAPYKSVSELVSYARKKSDGLTIGNAGVGSTSHLVSALFASKAGAKVMQVPYKGVPPAITDLMGGTVDVVFDQSNTALGNVGGGKLKALALTSMSEMPQYPGVKPLAEQGFPGFEASTWYGLYAPRGTPKAAIATLHRAYLAALADTQWTKSMADRGTHLLPQEKYAPDALRQHTASEIQKWRQVVRENNIQLN